MLRDSWVLRALPPAELEQLARQMRPRSYRRGEVIVHQGDPADSLHVIVQGHVKVVLFTETGEEALLSILGQGELFGELALLDSSPRSATIVALEPVETAVLTRTEFLALLRRSPAAVDELLASLARMIRRKDTAVADLIGLDVHGRLAKKLVELAEAHGRPRSGAVEIDVPLTQEELAAMIGAPRASVNRLLGFYESRGVIARRGRRIAVLKLDVLRELA
jgi:CRP/FNR family transcriptional regulator/CRP/FNR family cyclic AMP-dependent transcriptional regulator